MVFTSPVFIQLIIINKLKFIVKNSFVHGDNSNTITVIESVEYDLNIVLHK